MILLATLLAGAVAATDSLLDLVDLGGDTVLVGRVLDCSPDGVRFLPASGNEMFLPPSAVRSVVFADGSVCRLAPAAERPSRWGTGLLSFVVLPIAGTAIGGVVGGATCGYEETNVCAGFGSLVGLGAGLVLGTVVFVVSGREPGTDARAVADPPRAPADPPLAVSRKTALSFAFHF